MLDPRNRQLLLSSLRPPDGYAFDCAIGTTYSLDLIALLTTPLAFAMFDWHNDKGKLASDPQSQTSDPLALLESLRRSADRIHIFCQAGQIKVPPTHQRLLTYLEQSVIEVRPPATMDGKPVVFHPKVWVLRYLSSDQSTHYRLVCLSRNLTFDRAWDTVLILDGTLKERVRAIALNRPLSEFVAALPSMALRPESSGARARADVQQVASDLLVVDWEPPEHVDQIRFWPMGHAGRKQVWPFAERMDRLLVISPFVSENFLSRLAETCADRCLVSRLESLGLLPPEALRGVWQCKTLDEGLEINKSDDAIDTDTDAANQELLSGLHAKVYVAESGWNAHVWMGSANATHAAFNGNVEFLVELVGKKSKLGIDAILDGPANGAGLHAMLLDYIPALDKSAIDADQAEAELAADRARDALIDLDWCVHVTSKGDDFNTQIVTSSPWSPPPGVSTCCRPMMLPPSDSRYLDGDSMINLTFGPHARESISSFVVFEVTAKVRKAELRRQFTLNLPLDGAPTDRKERLLRDLLKDAPTLLRFLMMLLSDDPERLFDEMRETLSQPNGPSVRGSKGVLPLLEQLLRALDRTPEKIEHVHRLVEDLRSTPEGQSILPPEFDHVWEPIQRAHRALVEAKGVSA